MASGPRPVVVTRTQKQRWDADGRTGRIITEAINAERDAANLRAQRCKLHAGELGPDSVVLSGNTRLHARDPVIFRRQCHLGPGMRRLENGPTGTVVAVDGVRTVVTVRTDDPQPRDLEVRRDPSPLLGLHYAAHVHKAQGETVDRSYAIVGGWQTDREKLYVACSRAREGT